MGGGKQATTGRAVPPHHIGKQRQRMGVKSDTRFIHTPHRRSAGNHAGKRNAAFLPRRKQPDRNRGERPQTYPVHRLANRRFIHATNERPETASAFNPDSTSSGAGPRGTVRSDTCWCRQIKKKKKTNTK